MENILISIVTPTYNQSEFIEETIQSVLSQDYPHIEYIIIDGGSTDGTVDILKKYTGQIDWVSEKDEGQSDAINKGIGRSHGQIITWLCSDDTYLPGAISHAVNEFELHPHVDVVYGNVYYSDINNKPRMLFNARSFNLEHAITTSINHVAQAASFIRRKAWEKVGGVRSSLQYLMDWDLWLRLSREGFCFHYVPEVWAKARLQPFSKSVSGGHGNANALVSIIEDFFNDKANLHRELLKKRKQALSSAHMQAALELYQILLIQEARLYFWKGVRLYPPNLFSRRFFYLRTWIRSLLGVKVIRSLRTFKIKIFPNSSRSWANR